MRTLCRWWLMICGIMAACVDESWPYFGHNDVEGSCFVHLNAVNKIVPNKYSIRCFFISDH